MPIPIETVGLREAAERFGVSVDTLRRRIKDDAMPEAYMAEGKFGSTWVVPIEAMADIAERERWVLELDIDDTHQIDLRDANATGPQLATAQAPAQAGAHTLTTSAHTPANTAVPTPVTPMPSVMTTQVAPVAEQPKKSLTTEENLEWVERLLAAESRATGAETRLQTMEADAEATERRIAQLTRDLEHERAELRRLRTDLASEEKAKAVAVARTDELRGQLKTDRIDFEARIGVAKAEAQSHSERAEELALKLGNAEASMGWWSKRRFSRLLEG